MGEAISIVAKYYAKKRFGESMNTHKEPNWCKTSQQWVEELYPAGNPVLDPDGWDRKDFEYSWHQEPISRDEFEKRLMNSTLRMPTVLVEPTPPSQIEEESQTQRSLREMYKLGIKHANKKILALIGEDESTKHMDDCSVDGYDNCHLCNEDFERYGRNEIRKRIRKFIKEEIL